MNVSKEANVTISHNATDKQKIAHLQSQLHNTRRELETEETILRLLVAAAHVPQRIVDIARELAESGN